MIAGITMASPTNGEVPVGTSAKNLVVGKGKGNKAPLKATGGEASGNSKGKNTAKKRRSSTLRTPDTDMQEKLRELLNDESICESTSGLVLEGFNRKVGYDNGGDANGNGHGVKTRKKLFADPYLRALIRISVDADLNFLWCKRLEEILHEDEDLARNELKKRLHRKDCTVDELRKLGATEQEIELATGHIGLRNEALYEEELDYEQKFTFILKQAEVLLDRTRHNSVQEALQKLNILSSYLNLFTKNTDTFEETLEEVIGNTTEAVTHAVESADKLEISADSIQVDLAKCIIQNSPVVGRKGSSTMSKMEGQIHPSFLHLASFSRNRSSFFGEHYDIAPQPNIMDRRLSRSLGAPAAHEERSQIAGSFHSAHGASFHSAHGGASFHSAAGDSFHRSRSFSRSMMRTGSGNYGFGSMMSAHSGYGDLNRDEKAAEIGWKLLENGLRLYKFKRRAPKRAPKPKVFTLVEDQKLTWTGCRHQPLTVISADQELPRWLEEERATLHKWIKQHFHGVGHFQENCIRLRVHDKDEETWEMLLTARSREIARSVLAVFEEEVERRSMIDAIHDGGRRSSLAEIDGKMERVHRRDSIDRMQTSERSKRSRNKVLIHQQGHSLLKKANMLTIQESKASATPAFRTKRRERQERTKEEKQFLFRVLQKNPIFCNLSKKQSEDVMGLMRKISITDGMELVHQGNFSSNFYIVESGQLACLVVDKKRKKNSKKVVKKTVLGPEDHFGETSLILKSPLPFSVVSIQESTLWALDQETFSRVFAQNEDLQKSIETLVEVTVFNSLDDGLFSDMILKCKRVKFEAGETIASEEDYPGFFYVLQEGRVLVKNNWYNTGDADDLKVYKRLAIPGEFFGDFEICYEQTFQSSYVADEEGASMLLIDVSFFQSMKNNIQQSCVDNLKIQVLHSLPTFASLDEREIFNVVSAFEFQRFKKGETIITKGATEDQFYFLKKGQCVVLGDIRKPKDIMTRIKGHGSFGELALLSDEPRSAWVIADSDVEVYSLRALQFNRLVKLVKEQSTKEHMVHVLQLIDLLSVLSYNDYKVLSDALVQEPYQGGDHVIHVGDVNDKLYIVSRGEFLLTRRVAEGTSTERVRLLPGNYFGERALMASEKCKYNVTASRLSEVCTISRHVFEQYCGSLSALLQKALKKSEEETKLLSLTRSDFKERGIIGRGAFGSVRLVHEKISGKWYAMKCLIKKDIVNKNHQKHLKQEIQIMNLLDHEMIIRLKKKWQDDRFIYLLTDVCSGGELFNEMKKHGRFQESRCKFYAACIVSTLCHMRERKIVYRDLKPENVLIDSDGYLKLIDFGFAKKLDIGEKAHSFCGTPDYIAPEVLLNEGYNYAVDIWGLGVLIYEMISTRTPFRASGSINNKHVMKNILNKKVTFPKDVFGGTSKECVDFMKGCLKKEQLFRLGAKDVNEMKEHPWFKDYGQHGWNALERKLIKPPYVPQDTDPAKIKIKQPKSKELQTPPAVQDYELDTIFADDDFYKEGGVLAVEGAPKGFNFGRRRSSVHSTGSVDSLQGQRKSM